MLPPEGILTPVNQQKRRRLLPLIAFPLLIIALVLVVVIFREQVWAVFSSSEAIRDTVQGWGAAAPLAFIGLQIIQVVVFIIPGEVPQIAGGYLFGLLWGTLYSIAGILIGSAINFFLARALGVPFVKSLFRDSQLEKFDKITSSSRAQIAFFLLFVIPGIPKDILCYVAGLSSMRFYGFLLVSMVGRLPGIIGSAGMGDAAAANRWLLAGIIMGVATILFVLGLIFRERIHVFVEKVANRQKDSQA